MVTLSNAAAWFPMSLHFDIADFAGSMLVGIGFAGAGMVSLVDDRADSFLTKPPLSIARPEQCIGDD